MSSKQQAQKKRWILATSLQPWNLAASSAVLRTDMPALSNDAFDDTTTEKKFTPLCSVPPKARLEGSLACASSQRAHLNTGTLVPRRYFWPSQSRVCPPGPLPVGSSGHTVICGWAAHQRPLLAGGRHSAWLAPLRAVDGNPGAY